MKLRTGLPFNLGLAEVPVLNGDGHLVGTLVQKSTSNYPAYKGRISGYAFTPTPYGQSIGLVSAHGSTIRQTLDHAF